MSQLDLIAIGEPMFEFNRPMGSTAWQEGIGGDTSNAIVAAARSGAKTGYVTSLGDDLFGAAIRRMWMAEGVDASHVSTSLRAPTGVYFITHGMEGHEFAYLRTGSAASGMTLADLPRAYISGAKCLLVSGISQAISASAADAVFAAIDLMKQTGGLVAYDTNLRLKLWPLARARAVTHEAMRHCDIALPGLEDAQHLTGLYEPDHIVDFYLKLGVNIVALTLGRAGCMIATPFEREIIAPLKVKPVDATGAGDTFDGAFLAEYLATKNPYRAGHYANTAAALSTLGYGAVAPMPTRAQVLAKMNEVVQ